MSVSFNKKLFWSRLNLFYTAWRASEEKVYDSFVLINGKPNEDVVYMKTWAVHLWLCGYELAETVFVFTENALYVVSSPKKSMGFSVFRVLRF
jgi:Xaa-Pro aminopeptidase